MDHQAAQKSTTTGLSDFKTTSSKVASVIANAILFFFMILLLLICKFRNLIEMNSLLKLVFVIVAFSELILI